MSTVEWLRFRCSECASQTDPEARPNVYRIAIRKKEAKERRKENGKNLLWLPASSLFLADVTASIVVEMAAFAD